MTGEDPRTPARLVPSRSTTGKPKHPRLLSGLPTRLSRELFAGVELVQLRAGQYCSGPAIPAKAAIASRTDPQGYNGFELRYRAHIGSSAEAPLSVSFRSLMGCRVFVAFAPSRIDRKEHFIFGTEQRMDAASKGGGVWHVATTRNDSGNRQALSDVKDPDKCSGVPQQR